MVALSATTVTHAAFMDVELFGGVHHEGAVRRQDLLTSLLSTDAIATPTAAASSPSTTEEPTTASADDTTTTEPAPTTTEQPTTTDATSPTAEPTTTQDPTQDPTPTTDGQTTTTEASPTAGPTTTDGPTATSTTTGGGAGGSSGTATATATDAGTSTTAEPTTTNAPSTTLSSYTSVVTEVTVVTTRDESGQETTFQTSTTRTSTGASLVTSQPDTSSNNPSMAQGTRNIIIGVTVGVGGAIVLGVAGLLFWRLRNKRRNSEESEDLVSYGNGFGGPGTAEKSEAPSNPGGRSPFQSTLESYHAPTQTNAASNF